MHKYVGNEKTKVYHINLPLKDQCSKASEIDVSDIAEFDTREEAEAAGYKPCELCVLSPPKSSAPE